MGNNQSRETSRTLAGLGTTAVLGITTLLCPPVGIVGAVAAGVGGAAVTTKGLIEGDAEEAMDGLAFVGPALGQVLGNAGGKKTVCHKHCPPNC